MNKNENRKKTYVLTVSKTFPKPHPRSGQSTGFIEAIQNLFIAGRETTKIHTIRANYPLWKKRIAEINAGNAVLSIRYWTGKPYNSKQEEIICLSGCGIQQIEFQGSNGQNIINYPMIDGIQDVNVHFMDVAQNDGLSLQDFKDWFKGYDLSKPMVIIQFTNFRY